MAEPLIKQACDMFHRDQFTASLVSLGLVAAGADDSSKPQPATGAGAVPKHSNKSSLKTKYVQVGLLASSFRINFIQKICI